MSTHWAPRTNAHSKLLLYESVVDPTGNVVERFSIIRAVKRGNPAISPFPCMWRSCRCDVFISYTNSPPVEPWGASIQEGVERSADCRQNQNHLEKVSYISSTLNLKNTQTVNCSRYFAVLWAVQIYSLRFRRPPRWEWHGSRRHH